MAAAPTPTTQAGRVALARERIAARVPGSVADVQSRPGAIRGPRIKVEATEPQYRDHVYRRIGDVFTIDGTKNEKGVVVAFSKRSMRLVAASTAEKTTGAQEALDIENEQRRRDKAAGASLAANEPGGVYLDADGNAVSDVIGDQ
jgi:hypothetical protein